MSVDTADPLYSRMGQEKESGIFRAHEYDDFAEWYAEKEKKETAFIQAFNDRIFSHFALFWKDKDGNIFGNPIDAERFCEFDNMMRLLGDCEDIFAPPSYVPLKNDGRSSSMTHGTSLS